MGWPTGYRALEEEEVWALCCVCGGIGGTYVDLERSEDRPDGFVGG